MPTNDNSAYVQVRNPEYTKHLDKWELVRSTVASEVKSYLRNVGANEANKTAQEERQTAYEDGASFYNFTKRTVDGMVGSVYRKDPVIELPTELEYLLDDADGNGQSLVQQSQDSVREDLMMGRLGLFVDTPPSPANEDGTPRAFTREEQNDGKANPRIQMYRTESIINWRVERVGSVNKLTMIVLAEEYEYQSAINEFSWLTGTQYRVLDFDENGHYRQRVWKYNDIGERSGGENALVDSNPDEEFTPMANSKNMTEIPFSFIGADNNDYTVDDSPTYPLADLNIKHYRNSADNEEMLFVIAQAMLVIAPSNSISPKMWLELNPNGVKFGSRSGLNVGEGGSAMLLQASSTSALTEAIANKENQAVQIGAQLITPTQQVTAESARIQRGADTSVLSSIANNVSDGYNKAIVWCMGFLGTDNEFTFSLSTDFFFNKLTAQDTDSIVKTWQAGAISTAVKDAYLVAGGVIDDDVDLEVMNDDIKNEEGMVNLDAPDSASDVTIPVPEEETPAAVEDNNA